MENDPLWQAFAGAWQITPTIPDGMATAYVEAIIVLRNIHRATPEDIAALTRQKLAERTALEKQGRPRGPYFFNYLPQDFYQLRQRQTPDDEPWKKYTEGRYAAFINNFDGNETAPDEAGQWAPAANEPVLQEVYP